jgi:hypothetical protein
MPSLQVAIPPSIEPVALDDMKNYLRVEIDDDDALITSLITAAREACEVFTNRSFINKGYIQCLDSFPYFADTQLSQNAMPPSYYALPLYSTTLWNYSQQIKLFRPPLVSVDSLVYMSSADSQWHALVPTPPLWQPLTAYLENAVVADGNGNQQKCITPGTSAANPPQITPPAPSTSFPSTVAWNSTLNGTTTESTGVEWEMIGPVPQQDPTVGGSEATQFGAFIIDTNCEPARLFPGPAGNYWPPVLYMPNAVQIHFTAGFGPDADDVPQAIVAGIMRQVADLYENRTPSEKAGETLSGAVKSMLYPWVVRDICPTRG